MTDRDRILADLPDPTNEATKGSTIPLAASHQASDPWTTFQERFEALGGEIIGFDQVHTVAQTFFIDTGVPQSVQETLMELTQNVWDAEAGITIADLAIAETGSFLISAKPGASRLASLAPPVHIVLLDAKNLVMTLEQAFYRMPAETCVIVTGPSRTADIEGVLVRGVHGPKRVIVALMPP